MTRILAILPWTLFAGLLGGGALAQEPVLRPDVAFRASSDVRSGCTLRYSLKARHSACARSRLLAGLLCPGRRHRLIIAAACRADGFSSQMRSAALSMASRPLKRPISAMIV